MQWLLFQMEIGIIWSSLPMNKMVPLTILWIFTVELKFYFRNCLKVIWKFLYKFYPDRNSCPPSSKSMEILNQAKMYFHYYFYYIYSWVIEIIDSDSDSDMEGKTRGLYVWHVKHWLTICPKWKNILHGKR